MELFAKVAYCYFRKKLHLIFEICLNGSEYASVSLENTSNLSRKVAHTKITTKTPTMDIVFRESAGKTYSKNHLGKK